MASACDDEAAGKKAAARCFFDFIAFTSEKRLVDLYAAIKNCGVRRNLVARGKNYHVALYQLACGKLTFQPISQRDGMRRMQKTHFVQNPLGAQLLEDADESVSDDDRQKRQVAVGADEAQKHRNDGKNQVEKRQGVGANDLAGGFSAGVALSVGKTLRRARVRLGGGQTAQSGRVGDLLLHKNIPFPVRKKRDRVLLLEFCTNGRCLPHFSAAARNRQDFPALFYSFVTLPLPADACIAKNILDNWAESWYDDIELDSSNLHGSGRKLFPVRLRTHVF